MSDQDDTPKVFQRPVLNPENRAAVMVLHNLALTLEATPRALLDIAKTIQLATDPLTDLQRERIAQILEDHAATVKRGAQEVRDTGG